MTHQLHPWQRPLRPSLQLQPQANAEKGAVGGDVFADRPDEVLASQFGDGVAERADVPKGAKPIDVIWEGEPAIVFEVPDLEPDPVAEPSTNACLRPWRGR